MEVYKPDWCETRENWSVYMFSPQNKWVEYLSPTDSLPLADASLQPSQQCHKQAFSCALSWLCDHGGSSSHLSVHAAAFSDDSLVMSTRPSFFLFVILDSLIDCGLPVVGAVFVCVIIFSPSCRCAAGRNAPERSTKEKSLSHPLAHSLDSLCADGHLREARPRGCVLASWQVPSVMQGLCVLVVLGHEVCSVPACLRRSICISLLVYALLHCIGLSVCVGAYVHVH